MDEKFVLLDKEGYLTRDKYDETKHIKVIVNDDIYEMLSSCKNNYIWKYDFTNKEISMVLIDTIENLKDLREKECFRIVDNRSPMWYNSLSEEHRQELNAWYQAWLDVTETKIIPPKPEWL